MDIGNKIHAKLKKILKKLKNLGIIQKFKLEINFRQVEGSLRNSLVEIDTVLRKCLRKIINKPRKAEIRNIISELVRKKNLSDIVIAKEPIQGGLLDEKSFLQDSAALALKFKCSFCEEVFNSKKNFIIHKKTHKDSAEYLCDKCGKFCNGFQKWQEHLKEHHEQNLLPFTLRNFMSSLNNEMLVFDNCDFNVVPENQTQDNNTSENILIQTIDERQLKTAIGNKNVESLVSENKEKNFTCSCGKVFHILKTLRKHEKLKHSIRNVKYDCISCGKSFIEIGKLNRHMLSHKDSQYNCSFCLKEFSRSDTLKRHMALSHYTPKEFSCGFCKKKFKLKFNRDTHEENVHKNVNGQFQCQQCGLKLKNTVTLKSHIKTHSERKITCNTCCKSFSRKTYYRSHMKTKHFDVIPQQRIPELGSARQHSQVYAQMTGCQKCCEEE